MAKGGGHSSRQIVRRSACIHELSGPHCRLACVLNTPEICILFGALDLYKYQYWYKYKYMYHYLYW